MPKALRAPQFLDPMWFNRVRHGRHEAVVRDGGRVEVRGQILQMTDGVEPAGIKGQVWIDRSGQFTFASQEELEKDALRQQQERDRHAAQEKLLLDGLREEARVRNDRLRLPVKWTAGQKDVLSGLSRSSTGNGRNRATVNHILLQEPLSKGRLIRKEGDFLCASDSAGNGKRWSGRPEAVAFDGDGRPYAPAVNCRSCLRLAASWIDSEEVAIRPQDHGEATEITPDVPR